MKLVIVGNGPYAEMMSRYISMSTNDEVIAFAVEKEYISQIEINGLRVISIEELQSNYSSSDIMLVMGIGYKNMSNIRKRIFEMCKDMGYSFYNYIHPTAIILPDIIIGEGNNILEGAIVETGVKIGNCNLLFGGSMIGHESIVGDYNTFAGKSMIAGCVKVNNNCFLGIASAVKDHVILADYTLLGATAYGYKDTTPYSVVVPAKSEMLSDRKSTDYL